MRSSVRASQKGNNPKQHAAVPEFNAMFAEGKEIDESNSYKRAKMVENTDLNRYKNILANDSSLVNLNCGTYINANLVDIDSEVCRKTVLTQGPKANTCEHFFKLCIDYDITQIFMLCNFIEKNMAKCSPYFPLYTNKSIKYNDLTVKCIKFEKKPHYDVRELEILHEAEAKTKRITHFHISIWPDFGVLSPQIFYPMATEFMQFFDVKSENNPLIHCSAGVGRSGVLAMTIPLLFKHELSAEQCAPGTFEAYFKKLRCGRSQAIQTLDQLHLCYVCSELHRARLTDRRAIEHRVSELFASIKDQNLPLEDTFDMSLYENGDESDYEESDDGANVVRPVISESGSNYSDEHAGAYQESEYSDIEDDESEQ